MADQGDSQLRSAQAPNAGDRLRKFKAKPPTLFIRHDFKAGKFAGRLIFIGDIHGCPKELDELLAKVKFIPGKDQVVLVGDLVAKGPDSVGVVRRARQIRAWGVRGNHDDKVVKWYEFLHGPAKSMKEQDIEAIKVSDLPYDSFKSKTADAHYKIARKMSPKDYKYLAALPVIMVFSEPFAQWIVVHGGLDPSRPLLKQKAMDVMVMRNITASGPTKDKHRGSPWFKLWGKAMAELCESADGSDKAENADHSAHYTKVIYGHDASHALQIHNYTKGLDSRCVYGGELTAFILPGETLVSVKSPMYCTPKLD
ncbi:hypothetical protein GGI07_005131 [Coemansia sp. Benny D115]|nr:hypothetical protein GGI07_005131 [Coemansia sp. Benny D115]